MYGLDAADLDAFEAHRPLLVAHAYRMLGDLGLAEDMVQDGVAALERPAGGGAVAARVPGHARDAPVHQRARFRAHAARGKPR